MANEWERRYKASLDAFPGWDEAPVAELPGGRIVKAIVRVGRVVVLVLMVIWAVSLVVGIATGEWRLAFYRATLLAFLGMLHFGPRLATQRRRGPGDAAKSSEADGS